MIPEEIQLLEAIRQARKLQDEVEKKVSDFPPEGWPLAQKIRAAAKRTVDNLELALIALRRDLAAGAGEVAPGHEQDVQ